MLGPPKPRQLNDPILVSLDDLVPDRDFYRHLERTLDLSFVRDLVADTYAIRGRPSIDPVGGTTGADLHGDEPALAPDEPPARALGRRSIRG